MKVIIIGIICILWVQKASSAPKWTSLAPPGPLADDSERKKDNDFMDPDHDDDGSCTFDDPETYNSAVDHQEPDDIGNDMTDDFGPPVALTFLKIEPVFKIFFDNPGTFRNPDTKNDDVPFEKPSLTPNTTCMNTAILGIIIAVFGWLMHTLQTKRPDWEGTNDEEASDDIEEFEIATTWTPDPTMIPKLLQPSESFFSTPSLPFEPNDILDLKQDEANGPRNLEPTYCPYDLQELPLSKESAAHNKLRKCIDTQKASSMEKESNDKDFKNLSCTFPLKEDHGILSSTTDDELKLYRLPEPGSTIEIVRKIYRKTCHDGPRVNDPPDITKINMVAPFPPDKSLRFHQDPRPTHIRTPFPSMPLNTPSVEDLKEETPVLCIGDTARDARGKPKWDLREPAGDERTSRKWDRDRLDGTLGGGRTRPVVHQGSRTESEEEKTVTFSDEVTVRRIFLKRIIRRTFLARIFLKREEKKERKETGGSKREEREEKGGSKREEVIVTEDVVPLKVDAVQKPFQHLKKIKKRTKLLLK